MSDEHLPGVYLRFRSGYPTVATALDGLGETVDGAGPLDERTARLVKLGLAIGGAAEGAVRSNARKALAAGATVEEVRHVALLAVTTCGFPAAIAGFGWIDEVLATVS
jgi:alkylhydroperoxidase/carboxymuconolactone decarboxylase family protein YurZ